MMHATTPTRTERPHARRNAFARSGLALALAFGLAACQGVTQPPVVPPGELSLTGINPASGNQTTLVTVTGENIASNATVTVGDAAATNVLVNATGTAVQFNPPVLEPGTYDVTVTQGDESETLADAFTFTTDPGNGNGNGPGTPGAAVYRVNAAPGGTIVTGWEHDATYVVNVGQTGTYQNLALPIAGTENDVVYQTERHALEGGSLTYQFAVEDGEYQVVLHFAEIFFGLPGGGQAGGEGSRTFNIVIEGTTVETNYDVFAAAGGAATAVTSTHDVTVTDGQLTIELVSTTDNAKISGIEIFELVDENGDNGENGENGDEVANEE